jgi:hypothetical protein
MRIAPTPQSVDRVNKEMANIRSWKELDKNRLSDLLATGEGRSEFPNVSREEFDNWRDDKEEIGENYHQSRWRSSPRGHS